MLQLNNAWYSCRVLVVNSLDGMPLSAMALLFFDL